MPATSIWMRIVMIHQLRRLLHMLLIGKFIFPNSNTCIFFSHNRVLPLLCDVWCAFKLPWYSSKEWNSSACAIWAKAHWAKCGKQWNCGGGLWKFRRFHRLEVFLTPFSGENDIFYSKCPPNRPISMFIKSTESPEYEKLFEAFIGSDYATKRENAACITIAFGGMISLFSDGFQIPFKINSSFHKQKHDRDWI